MAGLIVLSASGNSGEKGRDQRHTSHFTHQISLADQMKCQLASVMRIDFMTLCIMQTMVVHLAAESNVL